MQQKVTRGDYLKDLITIYVENNTQKELDELYSQFIFQCGKIQKFLTPAKVIKISFSEQESLQLGNINVCYLAGITTDGHKETFNGSLTFNTRGEVVMYEPPQTAQNAVTTETNTNQCACQGLQAVYAPCCQPAIKAYFSLNYVPTKLSELQNDTDFQDGDDVADAISTHNTSEEAHPYIQGLIDATAPNDGTLTIQKNGTTVGTFSANQSENETVNITVPTNNNELTNGAGYITGINSTDVTSALGYTPYNSSNPNDYQENVIETIKINGTAQTVTNKAVDITLDASVVGALPSDTTIDDLTTSTQQDALNSGITSSDVTKIGTALQPNDNISELTNDAGYTTNVGTVTSVNNNTPDANGNVTISMPTVDQTFDSTSANAQSGVAIQGELDKKQDAFEADSPLAISLASSAQNLKIENNSVVQNATPASNLPKYATTTYDDDAYFIVGNSATSPNISTIEQMFSGGYVDIPLPTTGSFSFMTGCRTNIPNFVLGKGSGSNFIPIAVFNPQYNSNCGLWLNMSDTYNIYNDLYQSRLVIQNTPTHANTYIGEGGGGISPMDMAVAINKYSSSQYEIFFNFATDSAGETWYCAHGYIAGSNLTRIDEITTLRVFVNSSSASFNKEHIGVYNYAGTFYALSWETLGANLIDIERLVDGTDHLQLNVGVGLAVQNGSLVNTNPTPVTVDQTYNATSTNAQSGTAVAGAITDLANKSLSNLTDTGLDKINQSKALETGNVSTDADVYADIKKYAHSSFDLSKFTVVGSPTITSDGIASGFSSADYLNVSLAFSDNFTVELGFKVDAFNGAVQQLLYRSIYNRIVLTNEGIVKVFLNEDISSQTVHEFTFNLSAQANTNYLMRLTCKNSSLTCTLINLDTNISLSDTQPCNNYFANAVYSIGSEHIRYFNGSIDLKQFQSGADGIPVFSGNKTGIDTIKPDDYEVVGSPTISEDGILSLSSSVNNNYLSKPYSAFESLYTAKSWKLEFDGVFPVSESSTVQGDKIFTYVGRKGEADSNRFPIYVGKVNQNNYLFTILYIDVGGTPTRITNYYNFSNNYGKKFHYELKYTGDMYETTITVGNTVVFSNILSYTNKLSRPTDLTSNSNFFMLSLYSVSSSLPTISGAKLDLNSVKVDADGNFIYQPCLKIPYTAGSNQYGGKYVDVAYRNRVQDAYEQGLANDYFTIDEENQNFTLPMGEVYGMIGKRVLRDSYRSGLTYWDLYSDRTLEQGGTCESGVEYTLPKAFVDTNYILTVPYTSKTATSFIPSATGDFIAKGLGTL